MTHLYFQLAPNFKNTAIVSCFPQTCRVSQVLSSSSEDMYKDAAVGGNWGSTSRCGIAASHALLLMFGTGLENKTSRYGTNHISAHL